MKKLHDTSVLGAVYYDKTSSRKTDYLYRISLKCIIRNDQGEVLVVKESGRDWWDLPGGGMDHGEDLKTTIAREMFEEVGMTGDFTYSIVAVEEPNYLGAHNFWQLRLIFEVKPEEFMFVAGDDGDEIAFKNPSVFKTSSNSAERRIYLHSQQV